MNLPSPYVECGESLSIVLAGSLRLRLWPGAGTGPSTDAVRGFQNTAAIGDWTLANLTWSAPCELSEFETGQSGQYVAEITGPGVEAPNLVEVTFYSCRPIGTADAWSADYAFEETQTGWRLGAKRELIEAHEDDAPHFAQHHRYLYRWFGDWNTKRETSLGPASATLWLQADGMWSPAQSETDFTPLEQGSLIGALGFGASVLTGVYREQAQFTGLSISGVLVDTSGLNDDVLHGSGGGDVLADNLGGDPGSSAAAWAPFIFEYDLDIPKETAGASSGAVLTSSNIGDITCPYTGTRNFQQNSWDPDAVTAEYLVVKSSFASGQPVPWDTSDLAVLIWGSPPRLSPGTANAYSPVSLDLDPSLPVGVSLPQSLPHTFANGATGTDTPAWRKWLGVGTSGKSDPSFNPDLESRTLHDGSEPIWDFSSYAYLKLVGGTPTLVTFRGVYVQVSDTHVTGSDRNTDFTVTETPFEAVYAVVSGFIDLHFPQSATVDGAPVDLGESAPFYLGRVDEIEVAGSSTLTGLTLVSCTTPADDSSAGLAYAKLDFGAPVLRTDYDAFHAAHNGAACTANLADRSDSTEPFSFDGRGVRFVTPLTGAVSGEILDFQDTIQDFAARIALLEGWTATYDSSAATAALSDGTNSLGTLAQDLEPLLPGQSFTPGSGRTLQARVMCRELHPVNGVPFAVYTRHILGHGALEGLVNSGGTRASSGVSITDGTRTDTTDAHGFVLIGAVPANGVAEYELAEA